MSTEIPRLLEPHLRELLSGLSALSIEGARGVGKTWLARRLGTTFVPVDDPDERAQLLRLGNRFPQMITPPVVLDEWQLLPELWDRVRRQVDEDPSPGRFILTGSSSPAQAPTHTGAGRIATGRLRPLSLVERGLDTPTVSLSTLLASQQDAPIEGTATAVLNTYVEEILRSGFPGIRSLPLVARQAQLDSYLDLTVRHDLSDGSQRRTRSLKDWMRAYAASVSTCTTLDSINRSLTARQGIQPAATTARTYRDTLASMWMIDPVQGWMPTENELARATAADKHQMCDPALAARLLGIGTAHLLGVGHPIVRTPIGQPRRTRMLGFLFESLVTQSVQVYADLCQADVRHLRTKGGRQEIDLIVEGPDGRVVAIEVKTAAAPRPGDTRHLLWLRERLGDRLADAVVITTGRDAYRDTDSIAVVPASLLGP